MGNQVVKTQLLHAAKNGDLGELQTALFPIPKPERKATLNDGFPEGITPLHKAAENGFCEAVAYLVENGSDMDSLDIFYRSPLYNAASENRVDVVKYLVKCNAKLRIQFTQKDRITGKLENIERESPLHRACEKGYIEIVRVLVIAGADVNLSINDGRLLFDETPLHRAAMEGHANIVTFLINSGARVAAMDIDGNSALHKACYRDRLECVQILVLQDYDLNTVNGKHETALDIARKGVAKNCENYLGQMTPLVLSNLRKEKARVDQRNAKADMKNIGEGDKLGGKNNNKTTTQKAGAITAASASAPQKPVAATAAAADASRPQTPVVNAAAAVAPDAAAAPSAVAAEEDLDIHAIAGKGAPSGANPSMMDTMKKASNNLGNLLGYSNKSEVPSHKSEDSAGGGAAKGATPTKSPNNETDKSKKSSGHGHSVKSAHGKGEQSDEDDPILASNVYSDTPNESASIGGMITSFMKNGFSRKGSTVVSNAASGDATPRSPGDGKNNNPGGLSQKQMKNVALALSTKMEGEDEEEDKKTKSDKQMDAKIHKNSRKKSTAEHAPHIIDFDLDVPLATDPKRNSNKSPAKVGEGLTVSNKIPSDRGGGGGGGGIRKKPVAIDFDFDM